MPRAASHLETDVLILLRSLSHVQSLSRQSLPSRLAQLVPQSSRGEPREKLVHGARGRQKAPAFGIEDEVGCLEVDGIVIDEGAGGSGNRSRIGAVGDREAELVLFNERLRLFPIVHRYRDDFDALRGEFIRHSRKAASWALQYRHQEPQLNRITRIPPARSPGKWISPPPARARVRGDDTVILQHHNRAPCLKCLALKAPNDPSASDRKAISHRGGRTPAGENHLSPWKR
jgi:hypothetical protein